jgi:hypothetical protein
MCCEAPILYGGRFMAETYPILPLDQLADRHPGLTPAIAASDLEAASVCLSRHHRSPTEFEIQDNGASTIVTMAWVAPSPRIQMAWANTTDTTEAGAYACAIAAIEQSRGLFTIRRAETLTGADYYIGPIGSDPQKLRNCYRLEISGTDLATLEVRRRLKVKLTQARLGNSPLPAVAVVVGFKASLILIQTLED